MDGDIPPPGGRLRVGALGAWAGQQVGSATYAGAAHAVLWTGSAASFVDLHPAGASASVALASSGARQVGSATIDGASHAALWSGTPASFIDLHPSGPFTVSSAAASAGETQVCSVDASAATWAGSAASFQPLTGLGNPSAALGIRGATIAGYSTVNSVRRAVRFLPGSPELLYDGAGVVGESAALGVGNTAAGYTILGGVPYRCEHVIQRSRGTAIGHS